MQMIAIATVLDCDMIGLPIRFPDRSINFVFANDPTAAFFKT